MNIAVLWLQGAAYASFTNGLHGRLYRRESRAAALERFASMLAIRQLDGL